MRLRRALPATRSIIIAMFNAENYSQIRASLPAETTLVAVSKYHPAADIEAAYAAGQRHFGESRVQELVPKAQQLPDDICWHFIGHLQTNKVKQIVPFVSLIQSVDSLRLLREIDRQAALCNRVVDVLLELHVAQEESKTGLSSEACISLLQGEEWRQMSHVRICGLMTMASFTDNQAQIAREFDQADQLFRQIRQTFFADEPQFRIRSWGMSDDHGLALRHGSNMVRIGSALFGERVY